MQRECAVRPQRGLRSIAVGRNDLRRQMNTEGSTLKCAPISNQMYLSSYSIPNFFKIFVISSKEKNI